MFISVDLPAPFSPSRQWISPGATSRSMWSFAVSAPKRFVMPCSCSRTRAPSSRVVERGRTGSARPRSGGSLEGGRRRARDGAVLDARLDGLQLAGQRRRDLRRVVVEGREADATVLQRADVGRVVEGLRLRGLLDRR